MSTNLVTQMVVMVLMEEVIEVVMGAIDMVPWLKRSFTVKKSQVQTPTLLLHLSLTYFPINN